MSMEKTLATNRKARHDYFIEKTYEAGIALKGTEVKSIRAGKANLKESYCVIRNNEAFVVGMHISPYKEGNIFNVDPLRDRKLLLNKREILRINQEVMQKGMAVIPLSLYLKNGLIKMEIAIARGKKLYDKRESIKERDIKRSLERYI
ncbi:SsrA-binding protein SmpB [uncultured Ezakiella sp.]|uniref:SsrA-binding protein SmpB n=1 Tax=uncultured Ezakiella sp. TaxID=1637529 RepID=UPI0025DCB98E|nr:SsrA-binding protein SmpB [uncultured Ezakiella sp.]